MSTTKPKISKEVAAKEFDRLADAWDIDIDREHMEDEDKISFDQLRHRIERNIMRGRLVVSEDGEELAQYLAKGGASVKPITYTVPAGAGWLTMDQHKERQSMHKVFGFLASMAKEPVAYFSNLDGRDIKVAQDIGVLFLG